MQHGFDVQLIDNDGVVCLVLLGEIDAAASPTVRAEIDRALAQDPQRLTVDLSGTTFLDSAGITELVALRNGAVEHSCVVDLLPGPANVMRILDIVGLADMFDRAV